MSNAKSCQRVVFKPELECDCRIMRAGYAGGVLHMFPCKKAGVVDWLTQSGETIVCGRTYRWINNDGDWARKKGHKETNVVAEVTRITTDGRVYAFWNQDSLDSDQFGYETCIPNSAVVEEVVLNKV